MKFSIEVETDKNNSIISAIVVERSELGQLVHDPIVLEKATLTYPPGDSWLVFSDERRGRMIVLSQL